MYADLTRQVEVANYMVELLEVPTGVRTLADLIAFNTAHADEELVQPFWTSQSTWVLALFRRSILTEFAADQVHRIGEHHHEPSILRRHRF